MYDKQFVGIITKVSVVAKKDKGENHKSLFHQIKLETADIDYESMNEFDKPLTQSLLSVQPIPFDHVTFGKRCIKDLVLKIKTRIQGDDDSNINNNNGLVLKNISIEKILVSIKCNIPTYIFVIDVPVNDNPNSKYLTGFYKSITDFVFSISGVSVET
jgi:hypothetical protein